MTNLRGRKARYDALSQSEKEHLKVLVGVVGAAPSHKVQQAFADCAKLPHLRSRTLEKGIELALNVGPTPIQRSVLLQLPKWNGHITIVLAS